MGTPKNPKLAAKLIVRDGVSQKEALMQAGWTKTQANKGMKQLARRSRSLRKAYGEELARLGKHMEIFMEQARKGILSPADRALLARYRLQVNMVEGEDGGAQSVKLAGLDKEVGLWEPDLAVGVINMPIPADWQNRYTLKEVPDQATGKGGLIEIAPDRVTLRPDRSPFSKPMPQVADAPAAERLPTETRDLVKPPEEPK